MIDEVAELLLVHHGQVGDQRELELLAVGAVAGVSGGLPPQAATIGTIRSIKATMLKGNLCFSTMTCSSS